MTQDIAVVVAHYSPCDYELPRQHLQGTLNTLAVCRTPSVFIQVCGHAQTPITIRAGVGCIMESVFYSDQCLFWKENLWNIAASMLPHPKIAFVDADIVFRNPGWLADSSRLLDTFDVIQPFEDAYYEDKDGRTDTHRKSAAMALAAGVEPEPHIYHPGFAWCMTRAAFEKLGGFYDRNPVGGGDVSFSYCLDEKWRDTDLPSKLPHDMTFWNTTSFSNYREKAFAAKLKVGYLANNSVSHLWHGSLNDRQYVTRARYLPELVDGEYPMSYRYDGLLEWGNVEDSERLRQYFLSRREDG